MRAWWLAAMFSAVASPSLATPEREWNFQVLLDGKPIGYHRYVLSATHGTQQLRSEAQFNVRVLFIDAYRYAHAAQETWRGPCLQTIEAQTNDNGERSAVSGRRTDSGFRVAEPRGERLLPACVMSFAYWNPHMLSQRRLLNAQTGEWVDVTIERVGTETLTVAGRAVPTQRYRLCGEKLRIDLWYSPDQEWLALESPTEGGRVLRYQIQ
jgi:hypothetical protein